MRGVRLCAADGVAEFGRAIVAVLAVVLASGARADEIADARALDAGGRRAEAIALLESALGRDPAQNDVRVVLGSMQAWEGRYADARATLQPAVDAGRGDAARALVDVELWSGHPDRAERLAAERAAIEPTAADLRVRRARALRAVGRLEDAHAEAEAAVSLAPGDAGAVGLRDAIGMQLRRWEVGATFSADAFDDGRSPWWEASLDLGRHTDLGPASLHLRRAHQFDRYDDMVELEAYPHLREGTYAYVGAGFAAHGGGVVLYPHERLGLEVFQELGAGFEGSLGWRGLFFARPTHIATGTFGKYFGSWFAFSRVFYVFPSGGSRSGSVHLSLRRYLADGESYLGVRYARGLSRDELFTTGDFQLNSADTVACEASLALRRGFEITARASLSRQGRSGLRDLVDVGGALGVGYRF
jgi:YaiO family outer membrane protein